MAIGGKDRTVGFNTLCICAMASSLKISDGRPSENYRRRSVLNRSICSMTAVNHHGTIFLL